MLRKNEARVLWTEGLLLGSVHLQQLDRYHEALLALRLDALGAHSWGVVRVDVDRRELAQGTLRLARLEAVLPDGTVISAGEDDPELPPTRPVEGLSAERPALDVYVGIPRARDGVLEVGARGRYGAVTRRVADAHTADVDATEIEVARHNLRFVLGHEPREDLACVKIAEVRRDAHGTLVLDETFVPAALQIGASDVLCERLSRLLGLLEERRRALLEARRERDAETVEADASDVTRFVLLHAVSQALPFLHHAADSRDLPPRALYARLLELLGSLSTFSVEASLEAPPYEHTDLRKTFAPLFARLEKLLAASHRETCYAIELEPRDDGMHLAAIDERAARCDRFLLSVRSEAVAHAETASLVPSLGKVASWNRIAHVVSSALPGAKLAVSHRPPPEVPVRAGDVYFTLDAASEFLRDAIRAGNVAVFLPQPFDPKRTRVSLLALPARAGRAPSSPHTPRPEPRL